MAPFATETRARGAPRDVSVQLPEAASRPGAVSFLDCEAHRAPRADVPGPSPTLFFTVDGSALTRILLPHAAHPH